jgi:hypothetical protein
MGAITYDEAKGALKTLSAFVEQQAPPAPTPTPPAPPAPAPVAFRPGLVAGTDLKNDVSAAVQLGAKVVRVEWDIKTSPATLEPVIAAYAARGIRVAPLAGFYGRLPTSAEASNLATWAKAYGPYGTFWANRADWSVAIRTIEFGNETSYGYQYGDSHADQSYKDRARMIAIRAKEAIRAMAGTTVGLVVPTEDGSSGYSTWLDEMLTAVPELLQLIAGGTIHCYAAGGTVKLKRMLSQLAVHGETRLPIYITECGVTSDNGPALGSGNEMPASLTYQQAAEYLGARVRELRAVAQGRDLALFVYQVRDQQPTRKGTEREWYFGALQHEGQPKGAYTDTVKTLLASA